MYTLYIKERKYLNQGTDYIQPSLGQFVDLQHNFGQIRSEQKNVNHESKFILSATNLSHESKYIVLKNSFLSLA